MNDILPANVVTFSQSSCCLPFLSVSRYGPPLLPLWKIHFCFHYPAISFFFLWFWMWFLFPFFAFTCSLTPLNINIFKFYFLLVVVGGGDYVSSSFLTISASLWMSSKSIVKSSPAFLIKFHHAKCTHFILSLFFFLVALYYLLEWQGLISWDYL